MHNIARVSDFHQIPAIPISIVDPSGNCAGPIGAAACFIGAKVIAMATAYFGGKAALDMTHGAGGMTQVQHGQAMADFRHGMNAAFAINEPQIKLAGVFSPGASMADVGSRLMLGKDSMNFRLDHNSGLTFGNVDRESGVLGLSLMAASEKYGMMGHFVSNELQPALAVGEKIINSTSTGIGLVDWANTTFNEGISFKGQ